ncbi:Imm1 family immunity protein [Kitasatospora sp. NPDC057692]|uniref:Imm1 family immunity protein n=1 Tax=Kitasatospora sp. NPDC057692 TaxID=3346215 RepID=UPI0036B86C34
MISKVLETLDFGDSAWFSIDDQPPAEDNYGSNSLKISVNQSTGYGGVIWQAGAIHSKRGGVYAHTWVSDNPEPPTRDPKILSDPHHPVFMEPASALPISEVRKVLEEFYQAGTGDRPTCINWVRGRMNGEREELGPGVEPAPQSSTDWDSLASEIMNLSSDKD